MIPRSATPSPTNSMTSPVRTNRMSRWWFWTRDDEAAVVLLEHEAGVVEQRQRRLDQAPLVGHGQPEALPHRPAPGAVEPVASAVAPASRVRSSITPVAALAVVEPGGDAGDGRGAGPGLARDLRVVHPRSRSRTTAQRCAEVAELAERAQVAQEAARLVGVIERAAGRR